MVIGGVGMMTLGKRLRPIPAFVGGLLAFGLIFMIGANSPNVPIAAVLVCGLGVTMPVVAISNTTISQTVAPLRFRGRILATHNAVTSFMVLLGAAGAGVLTDLVGVRLVFNLAGVLTLSSALLSIRLLKAESQQVTMAETTT